MSRVLVLYYSMYGNVYRMAQAVAEGVGDAGGEATLMTVPELLPPETVAANPVMKAARQMQLDVLVATPEDLERFDAVVLGSPTRFGNMCAQMRNFWDRTSRQWLSGALVGKPAGVFTSTASRHGGQETTLISMMLTLLHHGMLIVGVPYTVPELLTTTYGGTPYGPSHVAGPRADQAPADEELTICRAHGRRMVQIADKLRGAG